MSRQGADSKEVSGSQGPFSFVTRRRVLGLGLGGVALTLGGFGALNWLRGSAPSVPGLRCLSPHAFQTLQHMARTHLPAGGVFAMDADSAALAQAFDTYLADEPPEHQEEIARALDLVEFGPLLFDHRWVTFSHLEPDAQLQHWLAWAQSDTQLRRQIWWGFARFFGLVFYDQPQVWAAIGYGGPSLARLQHPGAGPQGTP